MHVKDDKSSAIQGVNKVANFKVPILCYHSLNAHGTTYATNDHLALEQDLVALKARGYVAVSIDDIYQALVNQTSLPEKCFALTYDDAPYWDYFDYEDGHVGLVKSFQRIMVESGMFTPHENYAVTFAIASENVRKKLDKTCIAGRDEWNSSWWIKASDEGYIKIGHHSYDHLHVTLDKVRQRENKKGDFDHVDNLWDAYVQISVAARMLRKIMKRKDLPYFAYPYGDEPWFLRRFYLPALKYLHGLKAAFGNTGGFVTPDTYVWSIPRFACGTHWKSTDELMRLIDAT